MASVVKDARGRSPFWYACFTAHDGRQLKRSTRETARSKALQIALTLERAEKLAQGRTLTEVRVRELLSDVLQRVSGEGLRTFSVEEWLEQFVKGKRKSRAEKTALRHEQMMREFVEFLGPRARLNVAAITPADIGGFRDHREAKGLAPSTINLDIKILSAAFNGALRQGLISVNPCLAIEPVRDSHKGHKQTFTPQQVSALISSAENDEWRGLILLAFYTGARLQDCANLQWKNVDLLGDVKTIRFAPRKTGGEVTVPIHPALEDYLLSLRAPKSDECFLFPSLAGHVSSVLSKQFRLIMERAKIAQSLLREHNKLGRSVRALSFHSLRHCFTSLLANAGIPEELRMKLTGHVTRDVHQKYSHHQLQAIADAIAVLPRIK